MGTTAKKKTRPFVSHSSCHHAMPARVAEMPQHHQNQSMSKADRYRPRQLVLLHSDHPLYLNAAASATSPVSFSRTPIAATAAAATNLSDSGDNLAGIDDRSTSRVCPSTSLWQIDREPAEIRWQIEVTWRCGRT